MYVYRLTIIKKPEGTHRIIQKDFTVEHWFEEYKFRSDKYDSLRNAYLWFVAFSTSIRRG
ncbi:MAG: hypothetical protein DUD32_09435 [Lactobacillus sp.]|nr:MAG: hypothetical protein DUD32_09435 [Lactobacillus sp.]